MNFFATSLPADPIFRINHGANQTIDKHGTCRKITNNSGKDLMVATGTSAEWLSFVNNASIAGVNINKCSVYSPTLTLTNCTNPTNTVTIANPVTLYFSVFPPARLYVNNTLITSGSTFSHSFAAADTFYLSPASCSGYGEIEIKVDNSSGDIVQTLNKSPPCICGM